MTIADISSAIANLTTVFGSAIDIIKDNVAMMLFLAAGVVGMSFKLFRKGKKAVR